MTTHPSRRAALKLALVGALAAPPFVRSALAQGAAPLREIRIDFATYNPVGLLLKSRGLLEREFASENIAIRWVPSLGSNKALEFLNAGALDFGSTAGAAALVGRLNGNPVRAVYVYSRPEWTALVARDPAIRTVADLKGRRVAVTRGTDPHIFLVRALAGAGLTERDVRLVLLQHPDGRQALERGDVDAWAGLDPLMAAAEIEGGARLFHRDPGANTYGVLNVREAFAAAHPAIVARVLRVYDEARRIALAEPAELRAALVAATKLPDAVIARQLERTDLGSGAIGPAQKDAILSAGLALQAAGVLPADADIRAAVEALIDPSFAPTGARASR